MTEPHHHHPARISATPSDPPPAGARETLLRVLPYIWPSDDPGARVRVVISLALLLASKVIAVATPLFFKAAVDALAPAPPELGGMLVLGALGLTLAYGLARLAANGFQQLRDVIFAVVGQRAVRRLAVETFRHVHRLSLSYHLARRTGALSRVIERGVKGVDFLLRFLVLNLGPLVIELMLIAAVFFWYFDLRYLIAVSLSIALYFWFTFAVSEKRVEQRRIMNAADANANQRAVDSLLNFETVKYFNAEAREAKRYDEAMARYEKAALKTNNSLAFLNFGQAAIITFGLVVVMVMAARGVQAGQLTVGDFVMVNAYMIQITMPLNFLGTVYREIRQALVDMGEMFGLLAVRPDIVDSPAAKPLVVSKGEVRFENVSFAYDPARPILKRISFTVPAGGKLALVGASGAGKSTIGRLLFRFYDVTEGRIVIDGQEIRAVTQDSLHAALGVVPQDTVLFNDTLGYNIGYGKDGATEAEIEQAAKAAQLHEFIMSLPEGYNTLVGERGLKLSGGERQRVGIARALLKNPPILILDEATSALDSKTEQQILESLRALGRGRTVIAIAHRLSTIADADEILVLEGGEIIERGTHRDLLARRGRYAEMWERQQAEERVDRPAFTSP